MASKSKMQDTSKLKKMQEEDKKINTDIFQALELSDADEATLIERVCHDVETDERERQPFLDNVKEILDLYEGKVQKAPLFPGAANVSTRVVTMVVEILHAILYPTIWNPDLHYWVPVEKSDIGSAEQVSKLMGWDANNGHFKIQMNDWTKWLILEGTQVTKTCWDERIRWVQQKKITAKSIGKAVKQVLGAVADGTFEVEEGVTPYEIEYVPQKREKPVTHILTLEDVGFPCFENPSMEEEDLPHIWHRTRPFLYELQEKEDRGFIIGGTTAKLATSLEETIRKEIDGTAKQRMDAEGSRKIDVLRDCTPCEVIEWYGKWQVKGEWQEIVAWVERNTKTLLAATYLRCVDKFEKRPFKISQLIRRKGRMYGISMGDLVKEYQKILDEMQNLNLNAGKMATMPPGFYRAASGYDPEKVVITPGMMIPVDDINDVRWMQIPATTLPSHQEMRLIMEMVEKIASIGSYQSGQESNIVRSRSTARGTMAIIQQGERRFFVLGMALQAHLSDILKDRLRYYQQYMSPQMAERILGKDGKQLFEDGLQQDQMAGEYDVMLGLDSTGGSKSQQAELASMIYQNYIQNPLVAQSPDRVWEISSRPLKAVGEPDIESIIGPKPEVPPVIPGGGVQGQAVSPSSQPPQGGASPEQTPPPPPSEAPVA